MFLSGKAGRDVLKGGAGDDTLYGFGGDDSLSGGGGQDVLAGNEGNDTLSGGTGDDYLLGGLGNDVIDGGAGVDWAAYEDATAAVKVDLNLTVAQATGGAGSDKLTGIENLYGSAFNDTLIGNAGVNYLSGGAGNDRLEGGAGDDHLEGGRGNDTIIGGDGWDVVSYDDTPWGVSVNLGVGTAIQSGYYPINEAETDLILGVEDVYGSAHADYLIGDRNDNYLMGNDGDDELRGGEGGSDTLIGGAGNDKFWEDAGAAYTLVDGGDGFDTYLADSRNFGTTFDLRDGSVRETISGASKVKLSSIEAIYGTSQGDVFYDAVGKNEYYGGYGGDIFIFPHAEASDDPTKLNSILDFKMYGPQDGDRISIGITGSVAEFTAQTYSGAFTEAKTLIGAGLHDIVAYQVGGDVYVFSDSLKSNTLSTALKLQGMTLDRLLEADFI